MLRVKLNPSLPENFDSKFFRSFIGKGDESVFGKAGIIRAELHAYS